VVLGRADSMTVPPKSELRFPSRSMCGPFSGSIWPRSTRECAPYQGVKGLPGMGLLSAYQIASCEGQVSSTMNSLPTSNDAVGHEPSRRSHGSCSVSTEPASRTYDTSVDRHYKLHGALPRPNVMHRVISIQMNSDRDNILVIGDVHGCLEELQDLVEEATTRNDGIEFDCIILVGDLVNKGPSSADVVRKVREMGWLCVRGNHDDGALMAAVGDQRRQHQRRYEWVKDLSDEDVLWLSELPYTIRIRHVVDQENTHASWQGEDSALVIVHAGFVPGVDLEHQAIQDMITLRNVAPAGQEGEYVSEYHRANLSTESAVPWASAWKGPGHVIFGHDARRGLQSHSHATGLDSGCCYGKELTGISLPSRRIVQVKARQVYCPPGVKED
jgi:bis(5'-nucleosyl)-tetraphosphatase (symmetrical)